MNSNPGELLAELKRRELLVQTTGEETLCVHLGERRRTLYCGFDPTASSLHIGHLVPLLALRRFQLAGHRPIALVGGATGLIGDPSFKEGERKLNSEETVAEWAEGIQRQLAQFLDFSGSCGAIAANNLDWLGEARLLSFLRDVGKSFSVNAMIQKESVRQRIEREGEGISFTEFSYMILQAFDFAELNRRYDCTLQIGGSDQWGNITAGIDLTRRQNRVQVHGLTFPLVTKADGTKFGKTESGTVWLDAARTSPYAFYQFWINTADADVYPFLRYFTFLDVSSIEELKRSDAEKTGRLEAQPILATEMTRLVHGEDGLKAAKNITDALFSGDTNALSADELAQLRLDGLPSSVLPADLSQQSLVSCLSTATGAPGKQIKDALNRGAILINSEACSAEDNMNLYECFRKERSLHGRYFVVQIGKKKYHLFDLP